MIFILITSVYFLIGYFLKVCYCIWKVKLTDNSGNLLYDREQIYRIVFSLIQLGEYDTTCDDWDREQTGLFLFFMWPAFVIYFISWFLFCSVLAIGNIVFVLPRDFIKRMIDLYIQKKNQEKDKLR